MSCVGARLLRCAALWCLLALRAQACFQTLPQDCVLEPIGSNSNNAVGFAFFDSSRLLVAEKIGRLLYVENDARSLVLDLRTEVLNNGDRGLIDVAIDPQFASNGYLYLLLDVDPNADGLDNDRSTFARLV